MNLTTGWRQEIVAGHPCDVFEPQQRHPLQVVLIYLHGLHLAPLSEQAPFEAEFQRHGAVVVAPWTKRTWWTDRICREFDASQSAESHVLNNVLPYIEQQWAVRPPRIGLFGTSMGGQGALRMAYKFPRVFPVVAGIAPAIDYYLRMGEGDETLWEMYHDQEEARQDSAILHIHPLNWPRHQFFCCDPADERWWDSADRLRMKLYSLGVPHEADLESSHGGHGFTYYNAMASRTVRFLIERLETESRRV